MAQLLKHKAQTLACLACLVFIVSSSSWSPYKLAFPLVSIGKKTMAMKAAKKSAPLA